MTFTSRSFVGNGARTLAARAVPANTAESTIAAVEAAFRTRYDSTWADGTHPYPGIPELLQQLHARHIPLAVLSNKPHPFTTAIVHHLFPEIPFAAITGQKPGIPHKPDPASALATAAELGLPAAACTVVGDSTIDLETARRAGMRPIAVTWGYHDSAALAAAGPDARADTPDDLARLLELA